MAKRPFKIAEITFDAETPEQAGKVKQAVIGFIDELGAAGIIDLYNDRKTIQGKLLVAKYKKK